MDDDVNSRIEFERWKMEHASNLAKYDADNATRLETFRAVISSAHTALKAVVLINGGAAVALLAFAGSTFGQAENSLVVRYLLVSLGFFVVGVLLGGTASGFTYLAQYSYAWDQEKVGDHWRKIIIVLVIGAYVVFIVGCGISLWAFWKQSAVLTSCLSVEGVG